MSDAEGIIAALTPRGDRHRVDELVGRSWECAIESGPDEDYPYFELVSVSARADGRFDVQARFMESERVWTAVFDAGDCLYLCELLRR